MQGLLFGVLTFHTPISFALVYLHVQERNILRTHPAIVSWLDTFWNTFKENNPDKGVSKKQYIALQVKIMRCTHDTFDLFQAVELAEQEWELDTPEV